MKLEINQKDTTEKALLVGIDTGEYDADASINELQELAKTAGAVVIGQMLQKRSVPDGATYVGSGRVEEICQFCRGNDIDIIVVDGELTPVQQRNLEDATNTKVIDRTTLILDIFANRARSVEGKLQVELAQLQYMLPRLTGKGTSLSRLGGGIGTRGPGETKLESDRRHIRRRIDSLKKQLDGVKKRRDAMHIRRQKNRAQTVAVVGYTNVGKSTLMNALTGAGVLEENKLFATLDPTARKLSLPDKRTVMLVDTVGLVRRLPHQLVDAFRSTLEEAVWADVILNVCDASSEDCNEQIKVTDDLLESLGCSGKNVINVLNKCDLVPEYAHLQTVHRCVCISAKSGVGLDNLLNEIAMALPQKTVHCKVLIPFENGSLVGEIRKNAVVNSEEYLDSGTMLDIVAESELADKLKEYMI